MTTLVSQGGKITGNGLTDDHLLTAMEKVRLFGWW